jgi:hypothetical protein
MTPDAVSVLPSSRRRVLHDRAPRLGSKLHICWTANPVALGDGQVASPLNERRLSSAEIEELKVVTRYRMASSRNPALWYFTALASAWVIVTLTGHAQMSFSERVGAALVSVFAVMGQLSAWRDRRVARALRHDISRRLVGRTRSTRGETIETLPASALVWTVDGRPTPGRIRT